MAANALVGFSPDYVVLPGEHLAEVLEAKGMSQSELATRMGRPLKTINEIVKGKAAITPETAIQLERALAVPAQVWNSIEAAYQLEQAERKDRTRLMTFLEWAKRVPVAELKKRSRFPDTPSDVELVRACLEFFGVDTPATLAASSTLAAFRKSPSFDPDDLATCSWLRLGELEAEKILCDSFDKTRFRAALDRLRLLTLKTELRVIKEQIQTICGACGVAVCFVAELRHTHVSGAARWLSTDKALIQLSCRYKSDDHFWFTFFHECAHILLHGKKEGFLEGVGSTAQEEDEANAFSANHLIARNALNALMRERPLSKERIVSFADQHQISAGIVVAQLQKNKRLVEQTPLNKLKKFSFDLTSV